MPKAPVPAAKAALGRAGLRFEQVDLVTTHNPFAVNDPWFAGPTGARLTVELLHALRLRGGGVGLFTGCAAGDTGAAVVVRVED